MGWKPRLIRFGSALLQALIKEARRTTSDWRSLERTSG